MTGVQTCALPIYTQSDLDAFASRTRGQYFGGPYIRLYSTYLVYDWTQSGSGGYVLTWSNPNLGPACFATLLARVLEEATGGLEFQAIMALARFGGLRCPSEIVPMQWSQVAWDRQEVLVLSPKTARHEHQDRRVVPLFPELHDALAPLWAEAIEGEPFLFPTHQITGAALTSRLESACRAAGVPLWPKPFQNMRATRETELIDAFPVPTVAAWLGHSPEIALKHYIQIVKEHHARAVLRPPQAPDRETQNPKFRSVPQRPGPGPHGTKIAPIRAVRSRSVPPKLHDKDSRRLL